MRSRISTNFSTPVASLFTLLEKSCSSLVNGEFISFAIKV